MEGFVVEVDSTKSYEKYYKIIDLITANKKEVVLNFNDIEIRICYSEKFNLIENQLTTLDRVVSFSEITEFDQQNENYMIIDFDEVIQFCTDRFSSHSLLFETNPNSIVLSNLQCPNTAAPNEWYTISCIDKIAQKNYKYGETIEEYYSHLYGTRMEHPIEDSQQAINLLNDSLSNSVRDLLDNSNDPIAILFSGGIDSSIVAYYALLHCGDREVELYNMSCRYENSFDSPDRVCARAVMEDLKTIFPNKVIHFIEIDVEKEVGATLSQQLIPIIYPNDTVMDLSIATATSLALTQEGHCQVGNKKRNVRRVLCGQGSDEQLGGYGRHRNAKKYGKLSAELELDFCRLWNRNVARDDRVNDFCQATCLYPFLNTEVIRLIRNIPEELLVKLELPENEGNKWILRELARTIEMNACSCFKKTAIQFGTRMAKMLNNGKKVSGADHLAQE